MAKVALVFETGWAPVGGHTLLAFKKGSAFYVWHLVGARQSSSGGSGHILYNNQASVECLQLNERGRVYSIGGYSVSKGDRFQDHPEKDKEKELDKPFILGSEKDFLEALRRNRYRSGEMLEVSNDCVLNMLKKCKKMSKHRDISKYAESSFTTNNFSLIGASMGKLFGNNCNSWAYDRLVEMGITYSWGMYAASFISPRLSNFVGEIKKN